MDVFSDQDNKGWAIWPAALEKTHFLNSLLLLCDKDPLYVKHLGLLYIAPMGVGGRGRLTEARSSRHLLCHEEEVLCV